MEKRCRKLNDVDYSSGSVVYWMSRDQRVDNNWALLCAQDFALKNKAKLIVVFSLVPDFLEASLRQYSFMIDGLKVVEKKLRKLNIPFYLLLGSPEKNIPVFLKKEKAGLLVSDFDPLMIKRKWKDFIKRKISIPFFEVDAHNIVPCWLASPKKEFAAYTFRPKIKKLLQEFLRIYPKLKKQKFSSLSKQINWKNVLGSLKVDRSVLPLDWISAGEENARSDLKKFIKNKLSKYDSCRNDPNKECQSDLSPFFHFGHISSQEVALAVNKSKANKRSKEAFLEELIVRKELSDNFCFYDKNYDTAKCFPDWAKKSLNKHLKDKRDYIYSKKILENAKTHDKLWNAAQKELIVKGKIHGYMRMYWAKKILEWSSSPSSAMKIAIYLNDKYELDGRDPNGYAGIAWSIGGVHDRAWGERKVFGKVRFMSFEGCKSKFDVEKYIKKYLTVLSIKD